MPATLENSVVATGLEKVSFHSNSKERQCQRMLKLLHNCIHLTLFSLSFPSQLCQCPGLVGLGASDVEMAAGSLPSVHPLCLFPLGCWVLFIGHILPDYTDPPSLQALLGGDHVSLS